MCQNPLPPTEAAGEISDGTADNHVMPRWARLFANLFTAGCKLSSVRYLLQKRHGGRYRVWNLSEVEYDASVLDGQVLVYRLLLKLLMEMESWLKADERNVAVMHCLTGTVFLCDAASSSIFFGLHQAL